MMSEPISPTVAIRVFRIEDYDAILPLWKESKLPCKPRGRDSRANLQKQLGQTMVRFFVAEREGKVIGTVLASHDGRKGWINRLAVAKEILRRGVAKRLMQEAETWLGQEGIDIIACLVEDDNEPSIRFFLETGYTRYADIIYFSKRKKATT
jgi:ribosomal protein S18 acetylase RimI-like enzyme